jgi:Kef-type K+ transport system membrane component KefB
MFLEGNYILLFLVQVFILLLAARACGELFKKWNMPALTGEILVGVILGPTILGRFFPELSNMLFPANLMQRNMLDTIACLGVLFMLLETGLEIDFSVAWRQRGNALIIAFAGIIIPIVISFVPAYFLPDSYLISPKQRIAFALFLATVMTISAMPVATRILHDLNLLKTELGFLIVSALAVNDIIGWVVFTIVLGFFTNTQLDFIAMSIFLMAVISFACLALIFGKKLSTYTLGICKNLGMQEPATSFTFACLLGLLFGAITEKMGIHALFGFFIAGIVIGEAKNLSEETRQIISQMVYALFVPLFFASIGLRIDFIANFDILLVGTILIIGCFARYIGARIGVQLSSVPAINRGLVSLAHVPGGMMEIVIALIALQAGLITDKIFVAVVFSGVLSSILIGPVMKLSLSLRRSISPISFMTKELIFPDISLEDRNKVIEYLASKTAIMKLGAKISSKITASALRREEDFGTGLGMEIAVPHVRMRGIKHPILAVARAVHGIDWNSPDGLPVKYIFFLVTPEGVNDIHVQLLSSIAKVMLKKENSNILESAEGVEGFWKVLKTLFPTRIKR